MQLKSKTYNLSTKLYFAYGANMALSSMLSRCPLARPVQKFTLRGWRLDFGHHATIVRDQDAVCDGALWEITDMCETTWTCLRATQPTTKKFTLSRMDSSSWLTK